MRHLPPADPAALATEFRAAGAGGGDESVQHFGAKGPITMLGVDVAQEPGEDDREWLNANGIAWPA
nr:hypothetical protein GCM10020093_106170 [Planobispora longispora]